MMIEDGLYIGIVKDRFHNNSIDRIVVSPLMELDEKRNIWIDISETRSRQIFPDKGLIITFTDNDSLLENQVIKFRVRQNFKYIPGNFIRHAKFSIDRNNFSVLWELLVLNFEGSESELKEAIFNGKILYNASHNSECLITLDKVKWLGNLKFQVNNGLHHLNLTDPENWNNLKVYQIEEKNKIKPTNLDNRIFIDLDQFGKLIDVESWQPKATFVKRLINRLHEHLEKSKSKSKSNSSIDLHQFKDLIRQKKIDKAILQRLQEHENMNNLKQEDISSIIELLTAMEPFQSKLEAAKELHLEKCREAIRTQAQQQKSGLEDEIEKLKKQHMELHNEIDDQNIQMSQMSQFLVKAEEELEYKNIEKSHLENQISSLKNQADQLEKSIDLQQDRINQLLIEFEHSLKERLNQFASEPTNILAEALANDAFLQFLLGKRERSLDLGLSTKPQINKPNFEIKQGACFETIEEMITSYSSRLEKVDLNVMLAIWTMTITLSGLTPVFKGNMLRRALNTFINHLAYGRCFELPLSPEIISIERLFSIGQSGSVSNLGILDSAILCAATHHESLFILVLDGLDRAPSQYFLDTLLDWYSRSLMNIPSDTFFYQHIQGLKERHSLTNDIVSWPSNLLLVATIKGLNDGFPVSNNALEKIIEIEIDSQGKHQDIHPQILDQIALKPAGEVTANQFNEWREETLHQDIEPANEIIESFPKDYQPNIEIKETTRRLFAAAFNLCANLELFKENAINHAKTIVSGYYFSKHVKTDAAHQK